MYNQSPRVRVTWPATSASWDVKRVRSEGVPDSHQGRSSCNRLARTCAQYYILWSREVEGNRAATEE